MLNFVFIRPLVRFHALAGRLHHSLHSSVSSVVSDLVKSNAFRSLSSVFSQFVLGWLRLELAWDTLKYLIYEASLSQPQT